MVATVSLRTILDQVTGAQKVRSANLFPGNREVSSSQAFATIYTSLLLVIARSTEKELARQVSYLKAENQILRSRLPDKIRLIARRKLRWRSTNITKSKSAGCD
jgi:putative transposase